MMKEEVQYLPGTEPAAMKIRSRSIIEERETMNVAREGMSGEVTVEVEQQLIEATDKELGEKETYNITNRLIEVGERNSE